MGQLLKISEIIRQKYSYIIISTLIISVIIGLYTSYPGMMLKKFTVAFVIIMIASMGVTTTFRSFAFALKNLKGFSLGIALNFILSPILCYLISLAIQNSEIATGLILIGVVPCAGMAIVWAGLLEGDVPLAIVINTGTMIIAPFLIPLLMILFAGSYVKINTINMLINLIYTILLPVIVGMSMREAAERKKKNVRKMMPLFPAISSLCAVFLMFIAVNTSMPILLKNLDLLPSLVLTSLAIFPTMFGFAHLFGRKFFRRAEDIAITYSAGMKNLPIALGIAVMSFASLTALPIAVGFAFQMLTAVVFYKIFGGG